MYFIYKNTPNAIKYRRNNTNHTWFIKNRGGEMRLSALDGEYLDGLVIKGELVEYTKNKKRKKIG